MSQERGESRVDLVYASARFNAGRFRTALRGTKNSVVSSDGIDSARR